MSADHNGYGVSAETFQAIIRERKDEKNRKAEEKRVEVLKSIRDIKSKSGINPLDQFPKEVWEMVLDDLKEPEDLCNVSQIHGVFEDLLESRKVRDMLFPQVVGFPIQLDPNRPAYRNGKPIPLARGLRIRTLSKSMSNEIDRWYEDNLLQHLRSEANVNTVKMATIGLSESKVVEFLKDFVGSGLDEPMAKRFLQRSIRTDLLTPAIVYETTVPNEEIHRFLEQCDQERNDICSFLQVIGDQVWHLKYNVEYEALESFGMTFTRIYDTLLEYVKLMPNLKWLDLRFNWSSDYGAEKTNRVSIASHLATHSFPFLEHLERIDLVMNSTSIEMFEIFEEIFSANRHLKRLNVNGYYDELLRLERLSVAQQMDSLETFSIGGYDYECATWSMIRSFISLQWPLKKIHLNFRLELIDFTDVLQVLEKFQTLEHVSLIMTNFRLTRDLKFLALPNLTEIELTFVDPVFIEFERGSIVQFFFSLQFLLYCKKLKKLCWLLWNEMSAHRKLQRFMTNRECQERMINFRGGYRNLNYSNIWDVFPYLDTVEVNILSSESGDEVRVNKFKRIDRDMPNHVM